jgi:hypothetical protein
VPKRWTGEGARGGVSIEWLWSLNDILLTLCCCDFIDEEFKLDLTCEESAEKVAKRSMKNENERKDEIEENL